MLDFDSLKMSIHHNKTESAKRHFENQERRCASCFASAPHPKPCEKGAGGALAENRDNRQLAENTPKP